MLLVFSDRRPSCVREYNNLQIAIGRVTDAFLFPLQESYGHKSLVLLLFLPIPENILHYLTRQVGGPQISFRVC